MATEEIEEKTPLSIESPSRRILRRLLILVVVIGVVVLVVLAVRWLIVSKTNYRAWLIGTSKNCLVRVDTLSGNLYNISCLEEYDSGVGVSSPCVFQSGITDNKHGVYYATFIYLNREGSEVVEVGSFDIQTGGLLNRTTLPVLNFTQIQINPEINHTRLVGIVLFNSEVNGTSRIHQGVGVFEWLEQPTFNILSDWGPYPHPVLGSCCQEGPHRMCFHQGALKPLGDSDLFTLPQCKTLYEWSTQARPGRKQADVAVIDGDRMTQRNVFIHNLEYVRVPLETSLDDEKGRLYVLLGVPSKDGLSASQLRVYAVDLNIPTEFKLVTVSDFNSEVVYPTSISNIWYQKDYEV